MNFSVTLILLFIVILFNLAICVLMIWQYVHLFTVIPYCSLVLIHVVTLLLPTRQLLYHLLFFSSYRLIIIPPSVSRQNFLRSSSNSKPTSITSHMIVLPEDILCILVRKCIAICLNSFDFRVKCIFLFSHRGPNTSWPFELSIFLINTILPSW